MQQRETKACGGDSERHSTPFNLKSTDQPHSTRKQRETKEERGRKREWWRWRSAEARGRKIDEMRERESCAPKRVFDEMRKREGGESLVKRGERKNY